MFATSKLAVPYEHSLWSEIEFNSRLFFMLLQVWESTARASKPFPTINDRKVRVCLNEKRAIRNSRRIAPTYPGEPSGILPGYRPSQHNRHCAYAFYHGNVRAKELPCRNAGFSWGI